MAILTESPWKSLLPVETDDRASLDQKLRLLEQLQAAKLERLELIRRRPDQQRLVRAQSQAALGHVRQGAAAGDAQPGLASANGAQPDAVGARTADAVQHVRPAVGSHARSQQRQRDSGKLRHQQVSQKKQFSHQRAPLPATLARLVEITRPAGGQVQARPPRQEHAGMHPPPQKWRPGGVGQRIKELESDPSAYAGNRTRGVPAQPQQAGRDACKTPPPQAAQQAPLPPAPPQPQRPQPAAAKQSRRAVAVAVNPEPDNSGWRQQKRAKLATGQPRSPLATRRPVASNGSDDFMDDVIVPATGRKRPAPAPPPQPALPKLNLEAAAGGGRGGGGGGGGGSVRGSAQPAAAEQLAAGQQAQQQRTPPAAVAATGPGADAQDEHPAPRPALQATPWRRRKSSLEPPPQQQHSPQQQQEQQQQQDQWPQHERQQHQQQQWQLTAEPDPTAADEAAASLQAQPPAGSAAAVSQSRPAAATSSHAAHQDAVCHDSVPATQPGLEDIGSGRQLPPQPGRLISRAQTEPEAAEICDTEQGPARRRRPSARSREARPRQPAASTLAAAAEEPLGGSKRGSIILGGSDTGTGAGGGAGSGTTVAASDAEVETQPALSPVELPQMQEQAGTAPAAGVPKPTPCAAAAEAEPDASLAGAACSQHMLPAALQDTCPASMPMHLGPTEWQPPLPTPAGPLVIAETPADALLPCSDGTGPLYAGAEAEPAAIAASEQPRQQPDAWVQPPCSGARGAPAATAAPEAGLPAGSDAAAGSFPLPTPPAKQQQRIIELTACTDGRYVAALATDLATGRHHVQLWVSDQAAPTTQQQLRSCPVVLHGRKAAAAAPQAPTGPLLQILSPRSGQQDAAVVALASARGHPAGQQLDSSAAGVWLLQLHADGSAAAAAELLPLPSHAACVLALGNDCMYAGGEDGSVRCWQHAAAAVSAASPAAWQELPALRLLGGADSADAVEHLWPAAVEPLLLGARLGSDRIIIWNLDK